MRSQINLQPELSNIKNKVDELLSEIDSNAISRKVFYSGIPVATKGSRVPKLLESECLKLLNDYHSKQQTEEIKKFIQNECEQITASFSKHSYTLPRYDEFDRRIDNLTQLISTRAGIARRRFQKVPTWISTLIVGVIVGLIVVALTPWVMEVIGQSGQQGQ